MLHRTKMSENSMINNFQFIAWPCMDLYHPQGLQVLFYFYYLKDD